MPRIVVEINACSFRIDSSDRDTIRAWLAETLRWATGNPADYMTFRLDPLPLPGAPDGRGLPQLDWPPTTWAGRAYEVSPKGIDQFVADLREALGS